MLTHFSMQENPNTNHSIFLFHYCPLAVDVIWQMVN